MLQNIVLFFTPNKTTKHSPPLIATVSLFFRSQRVMGKLAVSRAIGDSEFKRTQGRMMSEFSCTGPLVTPDPDVTCTCIKPTEDEFLILACDGLWDVSSSQDAVNLVLKDLAQGLKVSEISQHLVNNALQNGSRDNVTAMVVLLHVA